MGPFPSDSATLKRLPSYTVIHKYKGPLSVKLTRVNYSKRKTKIFPGSFYAMKDRLSWCFSEPVYLSVSPPETMHTVMQRNQWAVRKARKNRDIVGETETETEGERETES